MCIEQLFRQFKLGSALYSSQYSSARELIKSMKLEPEVIESLQIRKMVDDLSNMIVTQHQSAIKKEETLEGTRHELQLLVLKMEDFKTIVEAAIGMMPQEAIDKLRHQA